MKRQLQVKRRIKQATEFEKLRKQGLTLDVIAHRYGVSKAHVSSQLTRYRKEKASSWFGASIELRKVLIELGYTSLTDCRRSCNIPRRMFVRAHGAGKQTLVELERLLHRRLPEVDRDVMWPTQCHGQLLAVSRNGLSCQTCGVLVEVTSYNGEDMEKRDRKRCLPILWEGGVFDQSGKSKQEKAAGRARAMVNLSNEHYTLKEIAQIFGLSQCRVRVIMAQYLAQQQTEWPEISTRLRRILVDAGYISLEDCRSRCMMAREQFLSIKGAGMKSLRELEQVIGRTLSVEGSPHA